MKSDSSTTYTPIINVTGPPHTYMHTYTHTYTHTFDLGTYDTYDTYYTITHLKLHTYLHTKYSSQKVSGFKFRDFKSQVLRIGGGAQQAKIESQENNYK